MDTTETTPAKAVESSALFDIGERLRKQDNRCTQDPMFCVQQKKRDVGYDAAYAVNRCWHDSANQETIYDDDKDFKGAPEGDQWDEFGYVDRWETVMVAFTEKGCEEYIALNGHNHLGELRIYAESFRRCPEMLAIRAFLMSNMTITAKSRGLDLGGSAACDAAGASQARPLAQLKAAPHLARRNQ